MPTVGTIILLLMFSSIAVSVLVKCRHGLTTDDTDLSPEKVSGMTLYTDYGTGVQYVQGGRAGGITPRLNPDGSLKTVPARK